MKKRLRNLNKMYDFQVENLLSSKHTFFSSPFPFLGVPGMHLKQTEKANQTNPHKRKQNKNNKKKQNKTTQRRQTKAKQTNQNKQRKQTKPTHTKQKKQKQNNTKQTETNNTTHRRFVIYVDMSWKKMSGETLSYFMKNILFGVDSLYFLSTCLKDVNMRSQYYTSLNSPRSMKKNPQIKSRFQTDGLRFLNSEILW